MEKGLPARGLREAGLEQEDRKEDWLSVCVLTEPCGDKGREERAAHPPGPFPSGLPLSSGCWGSRSMYQPTWKRVASTSTELSPLVCLGEAARDLRRGHRSECHRGPGILLSW